MVKTKRKTLKIIIAVLLAILSVISFMLIADNTSSSEFFVTSNDSINRSIKTVVACSGTAAATSVALSLLPNDTATPIADKMADFSGYFVLILGVLYAEKFLFPIINLAAFKYLIPVSLLLLAFGLCADFDHISRFAAKVLILSLALLLIIPASVGLSDMIYDINQEEIESSISGAQSVIDELNIKSVVDEAIGAETETADEGEDGFFKSTFGDVVSGITNIKEAVTDTIGNVIHLSDELKDKLQIVFSSFVKNLAVLLVTSCVIPILVLICFIYFIKYIFNADISVDQVFRRTSDMARQTRRYIRRK